LYNLIKRYFWEDGKWVGMRAFGFLGFIVILLLLYNGPEARSPQAVADCKAIDISVYKVDSPIYDALSKKRRKENL
jgi:hypothetical protein